MPISRILESLNTKRAGVISITKKIQVGFLASGFVNRTGSGTAKQFEAVAKILCKEHRSKVDLVIFCNNSDQELYLRNDPILSRVKIVIFPNVKGRWLRSSRQYFKYSISKNPIRLDVLHFSVPRFYPFFWLFPAKKFVCTFHAGGDVTAPKENFILSREIYNLTAKVFYKKLNLIFAVSEHGRNEIFHAYGIPKNKISVIYPGTDDIWNIRPSKKKLYGKKGKKLVVVVGRWQQYKNIQVVSNAIAKAKPLELERYYFVFVGKQISSNAKLIEAHLSCVNRQIYETFDHLDEQSYANLINEAELVIVPSLNEGFSLPVFDAYSFATRVMLHAPSPAAQILFGKKGVFATDLSSSDDLLEKITSSIEQEKSDTIENRKFLKSIGATWEDMTKNYLNSYEALMGSTGPDKASL